MLNEGLQEQFLFAASDVETLVNSQAERVIANYVNRMQHYRAGIKEITTKLEILDEEFKARFDYNPIHHIESRLKSPRSIIEKLRKQDLPYTFEAVAENVLDIAGVRVICNYIDDIERIAAMLLDQDDITLLRRKDYIADPKESGYRSLHLAVSVPIFLSREKLSIPVEIQIRTIAMDFWASLEHKLKYKTKTPVTDELKRRLQACASAINEIDCEMQAIQHELSRE